MAAKPSKPKPDITDEAREQARRALQMSMDMRQWPDRRAGGAPRIGARGHPAAETAGRGRDAGQRARVAHGPRRSADPV